jgi:hypothetical protein
MSTALARSITVQLGGKWCGSSGQVPGPGHSKQDRSTSVRGNPSDHDDVLVHSFAGHDFREIKDEWRARGLLPARDRVMRPPDPAAKAVAAARRAEAEKEAKATAAERLSIAHDLWPSGEPAAGTVVEQYLASRGIILRRPPATVRCLEANPPRYPFPSMIAAFGLADEFAPGFVTIPRSAVMGVHLTQLAPDGSGKAPVENPRRMIGFSSGWPIVLAPPNDSLVLAIGEGIESALSAHVATGAGAWAAGSKGRLPALADKVPPYIETVVILAEADGQREALELASRLAARTREGRRRQRCGFEVCLAEASHGRP